VKPPALGRPLGNREKAERWCLREKASLRVDRARGSLITEDPILTKA